MKNFGCQKSEILHLVRKTRSCLSFDSLHVLASDFGVRDFAEEAVLLWLRVEMSHHVHLLKIDEAQSMTEEDYSPS